MKNKSYRNLLTLALIGAMMLSSITVFADDYGDNGELQEKNAETQSVEVTYDKPSTYTITIPKFIELNAHNRDDGKLIVDSTPLYFSGEYSIAPNEKLHISTNKNITFHEAGGRKADLAAIVSTGQNYQAFGSSSITDDILDICADGSEHYVFSFGSFSDSNVPTLNLFSITPINSDAPLSAGYWTANMTFNIYLEP